MFSLQQFQHLFFAQITLYQDSPEATHVPDQETEAHPDRFDPRQPNYDAEAHTRAVAEEAENQLARWERAEWAIWGAVEALNNTETTAEMSARVEAERSEASGIARQRAAEAVAERSWNPEVILDLVPPNDAEELAARVLLESRGENLDNDSELLAQALVELRWENPWQIREIGEEEITEIRSQLFAWLAPQSGLSPEVLSELYEWNTENNPDFNPETMGADTSDFVNQMERMVALTEQFEDLEMPSNPEEFARLMRELDERWLVGSDGRLRVPLSQEEAEALGFVFNEDGTINMEDSDTSVYDVIPEVDEDGQIYNTWIWTNSYSGWQYQWSWQWGRRWGWSGGGWMPSDYTPSPEIMEILESGEVDIVPEKMHLVDQAVQVALQHQSRYEEISEATGIPWELIAGIHYRESSFNFDTYLHNGEQLGRTTTLVPAWLLFHDWGTAAEHALTQWNYQYGRPGEDDLAAQADFAERFNGLGYRNRGLNSPYVWAGTTQYEGQWGMFVADGQFDRGTSDPRVGVMPIVMVLRAQQWRSTQ